VKRIIAGFTTAIAMIVGWITLATYFSPLFAPVRVVLVEVAIIVAAFGMILGAVNVLDVHASHIVRRRSGWPYSLVLFVSMIPILIVSGWEGLKALASNLPVEQVIQQGIASNTMTLGYKYVLIPIQATLEALLPFLLAFAAYRTLRMRSASGRAGAVIFLVAAILVLIGQVPLFNLSFIGGLREWILRVWAMAGVRGILLGVALGITATALRVLIGTDRPTSD
jgi:hypothetical protein